MLARELNVVEGDTSSSLPLLAEIMRRGGGEKLSRTPANSSEVLPLKLTACGVGHGLRLWEGL